MILAAGDGAAQQGKRGTGNIRAGLRPINHLLRTLGRTDRDVVVTQRESVATTAQFIELSNGKAVADLMARGGKAWLESGRDSSEIVDALFISALGRGASSREKQFAGEIISSPPTPEGIEDVMWMLAMHPEFQLIH